MTATKNSLKADGGDCPLCKAGVSLDKKYYHVVTDAQGWCDLGGMRIQFAAYTNQPMRFSKKLIDAIVKTLRNQTDRKERRSVNTASSSGTKKTETVWAAARRLLRRKVHYLYKNKARCGVVANVCKGEKAFCYTVHADAVTCKRCLSLLQQQPQVLKVTGTMTKYFKEGLV